MIDISETRMVFRRRGKTLAFDVMRRTVRVADNIPVAISHMLVDHSPLSRIVPNSRALFPSLHLSRSYVNGVDPKLATISTSPVLQPVLTVGYKERDTMFL